MKRRVVLVVLDGAADRPVEALDGKTPLEEASTPNIDELASRGACGIMDPISPGIAPGSDTAQIAFLGNDPRQVFTGRGPFEAIGAGIDVLPGDVCFRANFATVEPRGKDLIVVDRRAGRHIDEIKEIEDLLSGFVSPYPDIKIILKHTTQHRGALILRGKGISDQFIDTDPHDVNVPLHELRPLPGNNESKRTVATIHAFQQHVFKVLDSHPINQRRRKEGKPPVNMVLVRGEARVPNLITVQKRFGIKAGYICGNALIAGVCRASGLEELYYGNDLDLGAKCKVLKENIDSQDLLFFHVKETDNLSHDGRVDEIVSLLERIDEEVAGTILQLQEDRGDDIVVCITSDHVTSSTVGEHVGDPVPLLIHGNAVRRDRISRFTERECGGGGLGRLRGLNLLPVLLDLGTRRR